MSLRRYLGDGFYVQVTHRSSFAEATIGRTEPGQDLAIWLRTRSYDIAVALTLPEAAWLVGALSELLERAKSIPPDEVGTGIARIEHPVDDEPGGVR